MQEVKVSAFIFSMALGAMMVAEAPVQAAIITTGNVEQFSDLPDPTTWTSATTVFIGNTADGAVSVDAGTNATGKPRLGRTPGVTGTLTVDGVGSKWTNGFVAGGDEISNPGSPGGTGIVNISNGGQIIGGGVVGSTIGGTGFLNITTGGVLSGGGGTVGGNSGSVGIASVDGAGSQWSAGTSGLNVGVRGNGLLKVTNGGVLSAGWATVARYGGAVGRVILDGPGSTVSLGTEGLSIGGNLPSIAGTGSGLVTVSNGAALSAQGESTIGVSPGFAAKLMVSGTGSSAANTAALRIGDGGGGRVSVTDGGTATASSITINNSSIMTVDLGAGSAVSVGGGSGTLTNDGAVRIAAKASAANGTYTPISAGNWTGTGTVQALGGVYNAANHSVTVSNAATGQAGIATTIDRAVTQRMLLTDSTTGQQVGASFQATTTAAPLSLTASLMNSSQVSLLQSLLDPGQSVLSAWDFSATGYTPGDPVYLSLQAGSGQKFYDLNLWHYNGSVWDRYLNTDLAYDGNFASFVATSFSGYAVSGLAPVPVPAAVWLFGSGLAAMVGVARRKFNRTV